MKKVIFIVAVVLFLSVVGGPVGYFDSVHTAVADEGGGE